MATTPSLPDAALRYAGLGFRVLPVSGIHREDDRIVCDCLRTDCSSPGKHPLIRDWRNAASSQTSILERWWDTWPNANIGLICGEAFDVLDIDGPEAIAALTLAVDASEAELFDGAFTIQSGGGEGRLHMYFEPLGENRSELARCKKIQVLSTGRFVIAPPSVHRTGNRYARISQPCPIAPAPEWLKSLMNGAEVEATSNVDVPPAVIGLEDFDPQPPSSSSRYAAGALARGAERVATTHEGSRNDTLNKETFALARLVRDGHLGLPELIEAMVNAARRAGLQDAEIERTVRSAVSSQLGTVANG